MTAIYGSDFSVAGYRDQEFGATFAWDTDLLSGYTSRFLSRIAEGGASTDNEVTTRGLREILNDVAPDAVMILGYSPRFHREAFQAARRNGFPILFRGETTDRARQRGALKTWARDQALRWFYRHCDRLLYVGQRSREHFQRLGCAEAKLGFSPYCVDTTPFQFDEEARVRLRGATRASLKISVDSKVVLFSGKLSARKGPDLLLRAIKQLPTEIREKMVVLFLGSGDLKEALQSLARETPVVTVHFLGFQNQTQLSQYYHAADLLALPSLLSETWGLVVNDGLHHGLPCLVSDAVGCAPDLIDRGVTGDVFQTGSTIDLAQVISRILPLTECAETRAKCREKVSGYTIEKAAAGIAKAYHSVVLNKPAVAPSA